MQENASLFCAYVWLAVFGAGGQAGTDGPRTVMGSIFLDQIVAQTCKPLVAFHGRALCGCGWDQT